VYREFCVAGTNWSLRLPRRRVRLTSECAWSVRPAVTAGRTGTIVDARLDLIPRRADSDIELGNGLPVVGKSMLMTGQRTVSSRPDYP
jgi:hypothetical protein